MPLFTEVCRMIHARHGKGKETPEGSTTRAFRKNIMRMVGPVHIAKLTRDSVTVTEEMLETDKLLPLVARLGRGHALAGTGYKYRDLPIVVARYNGQDYLIDGNRRVLSRHLRGEQMTKAYVVEFGADAIKERYYGKRALNYEARRAGSTWWRAENEAVEAMLTGLPPGSTVLDVPVGTARYVSTYQKLGLKALGIDVSSDMLKVAMGNIKAAGYTREFELCKGNVLKLGNVGVFDAVVCTRLLNWLTAGEMAGAMALMMRACRQRLIVSIEIGKPKTKKGNRAHLRRDFEGAVHAIGGAIERTIPIAKDYSMVQIGRRNAAK